MFIIYVLDFSTKNKMYRGAFTFLQKSKVQIKKIRKKSQFFIHAFFFRKCAIFRWGIRLMINVVPISVGVPYLKKT